MSKQDIKHFLIGFPIAWFIAWLLLCVLKDLINS